MKKRPVHKYDRAGRIVFLNPKVYNYVHTKIKELEQTPVTMQPLNYSAYDKPLDIAVALRSASPLHPHLRYMRAFYVSLFGVFGAFLLLLLPAVPSDLIGLVIIASAGLIALAIRAVAIVKKYEAVRAQQEYRLKQFAADNGFVYTAALGNDKNSYPTPRPVEAAYQTVVSGVRNGLHFTFGNTASIPARSLVVVTTGFLRVDLGRSVPSVYLARRHALGSSVSTFSTIPGQRRVKLPGDWRSSYWLYAKQAEEQLALEIFNSGFLQKLSSYSKLLHVELHGTSIYIYQEGMFEAQSRAGVEKIFAIWDELVAPLADALSHR